MVALAGVLHLSSRNEKRLAFFFFLEKAEDEVSEKPSLQSCKFQASESVF